MRLYRYAIGSDALEKYGIQLVEILDALRADESPTLDVTTLEDIGFNGDILHVADGYGRPGNSLPYEPDEWYSAPASEALRKGRKKATGRERKIREQAEEQERIRLEKIRMTERVSLYAHDSQLDEIVAKLVASRREPSVAEMIAQDERDFPELRKKARPAPQPPRPLRASKPEQRLIEKIPAMPDGRSYDYFPKAQRDRDPIAFDNIAGFIAFLDASGFPFFNPQSKLVADLWQSFNTPQDNLAGRKPNTAVFERRQVKRVQKLIGRIIAGRLIPMEG